MSEKSNIHTVNELAKSMPREQALAIAENIHARASTHRANLEAKRTQLGTIGIQLDGLIATILDDKSKMEEAEREKLASAANLLAMQGIHKFSTQALRSVLHEEGYESVPGRVRVAGEGGDAFHYLWTHKGIGCDDPEAAVAHRVLHGLKNLQMEMML